MKKNPSAILAGNPQIKTAVKYVAFIAANTATRLARTTKSLFSTAIAVLSRIILFVTGITLLQCCKHTLDLAAMLLGKLGIPNSDPEKISFDMQPSVLVTCVAKLLTLTSTLLICILKLLSMAASAFTEDPYQPMEIFNDPASKAGIDDQQNVDQSPTNISNLIFKSVFENITWITSQFNSTPCDQPRVAGDELAIYHHFHVYHDGRLSEPLSFSFGAAGLDVFYAVGAAKYLQDAILPAILSQSLFLGTGVASLVACYLCVGADVDELRRNLKRLVSAGGDTGLVGTCMSDYEGLLPVLVEERCLDRLSIYATTIPRLKTYCFNPQTKHELSKCIAAACYIPFRTQSPCLVANSFFAANHTTQTINTRTITCKMSAGEANISPAISGGTTGTSMLVFAETEEMDRMYMNGYVDAKLWVDDMCARGRLSVGILRAGESV